MGVLLQAFYQRGTRGVPTPAEGDQIEAWWDHLAKQAHLLRQSGFTAVWLPPVNKGASGGLSVGYDVFDDYDIGSKNQKGTIPTRYGTREQLARCVAVLRANGLDVYLDLVENQRAGGTGPGGFTFRYLDADSNPGGGRFPKNPENFHPNVPEDPKTVPGQDFSFGSDLAPINGKPPGYVFNGLIESADWLTRALDVQGYRLDDVKGVSTEFMLPLLNSKSMKGKFAVGEFFDGNILLIQNWLFGGMQGRASAFDFPTRFTLARMCNRVGPFDMSSLDHVGLAGSNPFNAVTFVENHDTDRTDPIVQNKKLGYAYILTSEGYPCVFYKDYSTDKFCFGLKPHMDKLIFVHEQIAQGASLQRFKNFEVFAFERLSGPHLLTGLNNDPNTPQTITVFTGFGSHVHLHDYAGHSADVQTDGAGRATITIPQNKNGLGYVCYSRQGIGSAFQTHVPSAAQALEGAQDLDIKAAAANEATDIGRVFCKAGTEILAQLSFNAGDWNPNTALTLTGLDPAGGVAKTKVYNAAQQGEVMSITAANTGFFTFQIQAANPPAARPKLPFNLLVTYTAPTTL